MAPAGASLTGALALDGPVWRSLARLGASRGPEWFARLAPPVVGVVVCALAGDRRRAIAANLRDVRGPRSRVAEAIEVARTFSSYASCVSEVLRGVSSGRRPEAVVRGDLHLDDALARGRGVVLVTAHTGGWEFAGGLLLRNRGARLMIVEQAEPDPVARAIQDEARRAQGLLVAHAGDDPFSALPLLKHLREGGMVALQIDRVPPGMRSRRVRLFGRTGSIPEGPLRLAVASGAPIVAAFAARTGHRRYEVVVSPPIRLARQASGADLDDAAQALADALCRFVEVRPTQWFNFAASTGP
jgi:lauroyl/myristoyl acyltransferase